MGDRFQPIWLIEFTEIRIGAGASTLATLLFTQAFTFWSPATPVLLQPLFAVSGARVLLGERLQPRY